MTTLQRGFGNIGAWIVGRNRFGPIRGPWPDDRWKGWWSDNPPYHRPVFALTKYPRAPIVMDGGTTFHFVTEGNHAALKQAIEAAKGRDIRLGGGVATIQQYLRAGLVDEMHVAISPVCLVRGSTCSPVSTRWRSAISAQKMFPHPRPHMSFLPDGDSVDRPGIYNIVDCKLEAKGDLTQVAWAMHGPQWYMTKVLSILMDCDKMVGKDFEAGLASMKALAEK